MDPSIKDGAVLLISTSNKEPVENQIFAMYKPSEGLIVKRLVRVDGQWIARSDNREFPDTKIDNHEHVTLIGRAIWMGAKL
jgi:phage repressor protein C with HTH and peptisase S24 domain